MVIQTLFGSIYFHSANDLNDRSAGEEMVQSIAYECLGFSRGFPHTDGSAVRDEFVASASIFRSFLRLFNGRTCVRPRPLMTLIQISMLN